MTLPHKLTQLALGAAIVVSALQMTAVPADAAAPREVKRIVADLARDTAVPPSLALAVASVESGFRDDFESAAGTRGVMQISPAVAKSYGVRPKELWDARKNVALGLKILSVYFQNASHEWPVALKRYAKAMPGGYKPQHFARKVLRLERRFAEEIVTRKALEKRKREVLKVAEDGQYYFGSDDESDREVTWKTGLRIAEAAIPKKSRQKADTKRPAKAGFIPVFERRLQLARRNLDDFSSGRIPADMQRPRHER